MYLVGKNSLGPDHAPLSNGENSNCAFLACAFENICYQTHDGGIVVRNWQAIVFDVVWSDLVRNDDWHWHVVGNEIAQGCDV